MVEENGAENCSEKSLSLVADDVFGNYWWYVFNTNVCFKGYVDFATLRFVYKTRGQAGSLYITLNGWSDVPNFGNSEVLIKITEMPLLLAPRDKFVTLNIFGRKFSVDFLTRED
jgi:hypothetical protein